MMPKPLARTDDQFAFVVGHAFGPRGLSLAPEIKQQLWCALNVGVCVLCDVKKYPSSQHRKSNDAGDQSNGAGFKE